MHSVHRRAFAPILITALAAVLPASASALSPTHNVFSTMPVTTCVVSTGGVVSATAPAVNIKWESWVPADVSPGDPVVLSDGGVTVSDQTSGLADALRPLGTSFDATLTSLQIATTNASGPIEAASPLAATPVTVPAASTNSANPAYMGFAIAGYAPSAPVTVTGPPDTWVRLLISTATFAIRSYATTDRTGPSTTHLLTCTAHPDPYLVGYPLTIVPGPSPAGSPAVTKITGFAISYVGGPVLINGKRFTGVRSVQIGGRKVKYTVINSTTIYATAPAVGWSTLKDVTVTNAYGTSPINYYDTLAYVGPITSL